MTAVLVTLGILQYRWAGAVSEAASVSMQASLQSSVWGFRQELHRDLAALCPPVRNVPSPDNLAEQLSEFEATAEHGDLVAQTYWWRDVGGKHPQLQRFDPAGRKFVAAEWPAELVPLSQWIEQMPTMLMGPQREPRLEEPRDRSRRPHFVRAAQSVCMVDESTPAIARHLPVTGDPAKSPQDWLVVTLDRHALTTKLLPELATRFFSGTNGLDFDVAVVNGGDGSQLLYTSDAAFKPHAQPPDAEVPLFGFFPLLGGRPGAVLMPAPPRTSDSGPTPDHEEQHPAILKSTADTREWLLVVRHRNGSLEQTVARARSRNLTVSFGILLLLAATMALILRTTHRAQRLARLQMDFVAGVSHELRTPLSVIASAADNLADGIVTPGPQIARYGTAIKEQAEQLKQLVEQILLFAATRDGQYRYNLRPVTTQEVIEHALGHTAQLVRAAGVEVETVIAPDAPPVMADLSAISQCLQNLIINAVKYGGEQRWVGITAKPAEGPRGREVAISVADKGLGIRGRDLDRVFEPFYRGDEAVSAQIHGTGLGLTLARSIAEAMGGSITVSSEREQGTTFTLHLPATDALSEADTALTAVEK